MSEDIIVVNERDELIGLVSRDEVYANRLIHRSVHLILENEKDEILLQKRAENKFWSPGKWCYSVSGTVANETYDEAIVREVKEELSIDVKPEFLFKIYVEDTNERAFHAIYRAKADDKICAAIKPNDEVAALRWVKKEALRKELEQDPDKFSSSFIAGMKKYLGME